MMVPQFDKKLPVPTGSVGYLSNGGIQRYHVEADSSTGYVAWRLPDGTTLVSAAPAMFIQAVTAIAFWACAGMQDTTPVGSILSFDCHGNALSMLDVLALRDLEFLDCSYNALTHLPLSGLNNLQALDADYNCLSELDASSLAELRVVNCRGNPLKLLNLPVSHELEILDYSDSPSRIRVAGPNSLPLCNGVRANSPGDQASPR